MKQKVEEKSHVNYSHIGIRPETFEKLSKWKERKAREKGIKLSFDVFFTFLIREHDGKD